MMKEILASIEKERKSDEKLWKLIVGIKDILHFFYTKNLDELVKNRPIIKRFIFRGMVNTKPFKCNPKAKVEIHTLISRNDLYMGILALKSFLHFYNNVAVIFHDDGTLKERDKQTIKSHIINSKIIDGKKADKIVNNYLRYKVNCTNIRNNLKRTAQLFDYTILSNSDKLISLDSDILFLKRPDEIIKWIENKNNTILYNKEILLPHSRTFKKYNIKELGDLNCGCMCYYKDIVDFDIIERITDKIINEEKKYWLYSQAFFNIFALNKKYKFKPLEFNKYKVHYPIKGDNHILNGSEIMMHFVGPMRFYKYIYRKIGSRVIKEIKSQSNRYLLK